MDRPWLDPDVGDSERHESGCPTLQVIEIVQQPDRRESYAGVFVRTIECLVDGVAADIACGWLRSLMIVEHSSPRALRTYRTYVCLRK